MATTYTVGRDELAVHGITLSPGVETIVKFPFALTRVEITSTDGVAPVYFTIDGREAIVRGRQTRVIPASIASVEIEPTSFQATQVRLISPGTPTVSVSRD